MNINSNYKIHALEVYDQQFNRIKQYSSKLKHYACLAALSNGTDYTRLTLGYTD
jgi:hypothetical protein